MSEEQGVRATARKAGRSTASEWGGAPPFGGCRRPGFHHTMSGKAKKRVDMPGRAKKPVAPPSYESILTGSAGRSLAAEARR